MHILATRYDPKKESYFCLFSANEQQLCQQIISWQVANSAGVLSREQ